MNYDGNFEPTYDDLVATYDGNQATAFFAELMRKVEASTGPTAAEIAAAVRVNLSTDLNRLLEVWGRLGLDPTKPMTTGETSITFGDIVMAMAQSGSNVTVQRA